MADRASTNLVAAQPELDHTELVIFSGDGELREDKPPMFRWPVLSGGNGFEVVTSFSRPSPVNIRVSVYRYYPNGSGAVVEVFDIPYNSWTWYHPIDVDFARRQQVSVGFELLGDVGGYDPAMGILVLVRIAN